MLRRPSSQDEGDNYAAGDTDDFAPQPIVVDGANPMKTNLFPRRKTSLGRSVSSSQLLLKPKRNKQQPVPSTVVVGMHNSTLHNISSSSLTSPFQSRANLHNGGDRGLSRQMSSSRSVATLLRKPSDVDSSPNTNGDDNRRDSSKAAPNMLLHFKIYLVGDSPYISGHGKPPSVDLTSLFPSGLSVLKVASGVEWGAALMQNHLVYTWVVGQLGHGHSEALMRPTLVQALQSIRIVKMSCGSAHGGFVSDTGALFMVGDASYGRLGLGALPASGIISTPTQHMHVLKQVLLGFGDGSNGRLGTGSDSDQDTPTLVSVFHTAAGRSHTVVVDSLDNVYCWGGNSAGQLGLKSTTGLNCQPIPVQVDAKSMRTPGGAVALHMHALSVFATENHTLLVLRTTNAFEGDDPNMVKAKKAVGMFKSLHAKKKPSTSPGKHHHHRGNQVIEKWSFTVAEPTDTLNIPSHVARFLHIMASTKIAKRPTIDHSKTNTSMHNSRVEKSATTRLLRAFGVGKRFRTVQVSVTPGPGAYDVLAKAGVPPSTLATNNQTEDDSGDKPWRGRVPFGSTAPKQVPLTTVESSAIYPEKAMALVFRKPVAVKLASGDDFSRVISKRLHAGRGSTPGPGAYNLLVPTTQAPSSSRIPSTKRKQHNSHKHN
ncbi:hypothetical protein DYB25_001531 [Aphanomyces astaci]|uniref:Uncharacterized protein n=2 Tax=Aphanomyces astaci TaxID=112090 RepID=A0A396ZP24_APHAT|nr:hypothetical protein DYB25_001531 [Aphanomyces astaci]